MTPDFPQQSGEPRPHFSYEPMPPKYPEPEPTAPRPQTFESTPLRADPEPLPEWEESERTARAGRRAASPPPELYREEQESMFVKWLVRLIILGVLGFGIWYFFFREKEIPLPDSSETEVTESTTDKNLIGPNGGTVEDSTGAKVIIPEGALDTDVKIEILMVREGRVTDLYHLKPDGQKFLKPVEVAIPYKEENLSITETPFDISLWYGTESDNLNVQKTTTVSFSENTVSAELASF